MKQDVVNGLKTLLIPLGMWRTSLVIRSFAIYTVLSPTMGGGKVLQICRELAIGESWPTALQNVGEAHVGDNDVFLYGWAGALALLILGPRLGALIFASGMQTIVFLSRLQAPTSFQAEGHLLVFVPLCLAVLAVSSSSPQGRLLATPKDLERCFVWFLRGILLASLTFIVIHKTNADFLNSEVSCVSTKIWPEDFFGLFPSITALLSLPRSPWVGLTAEASLPLALLLMPRVGILMLVVLFAYLGTGGPQGTTWLFIALSFSFLRQGDRAVVLRNRTVTIGLVVLAFSLAVIGVARMPGPFEAARVVNPGLYIGLVLSSLFLITGLLVTDILSSIRGERRGPKDRPQSCQQPFGRGTKMILFVAGIMFLANELCPYLGIKHRYSLTMWSNLRADRGRWNSLLVPSGVKVFSYVDDHLVEVTIVGSIGKERQIVTNPTAYDMAELRQFITFGQERPGRLEVHFQYHNRSYFYDSVNPQASPGVPEILQMTGPVQIAKMSVWPEISGRSLTTTNVAARYLDELLAATEQLDLEVEYRGERFIFRDAHQNTELRQFFDRLPVAYGLYGASELSVDTPQHCMHGV
ncbi:MAG: hypothetical protein KDA86_15750 [Planctomycetaceae bacterium]|nr:hypothetical protein [Planctomycetaceae bacterium]